MISTDIIIILVSIFLAYTLRWGSITYFPDPNIVYAFLLGPVIGIPIFYINGFYNIVVRYMGVESLSPILKATFIFLLLWTLFVELLDIYAFPRSTGVITFLILIFLIFFSRIVAIWIINNALTKSDKYHQNVAIYGAGSAGNKLLSLLTQNSNSVVKVFIDDDTSLHKRRLKGIKIIGLENFGNIINLNKIKIIYLAIPSLSAERKNSVIKTLINFNIQIKILPPISELINEDFVLKDLKEVQIEDLLGREEVEVNKKLINYNTKDKCILVTGAGGSVGSEICKQILKLSPKQLILLDHNEYSLYSINNTLSKMNNDLDSPIAIKPVLGSVNDKKLIKQIISNFNIQTLYHAAAYKHVPLLEGNVLSGIKNNLLGTIACADAAKEEGIESFILISTDKAVNPTSLMGATKRVSESYIQMIANKVNSENECVFNIVRFGNVLDSSGSVIPLFKEQIRNGGPLTVTNQTITRYFMTIPEAAQLVIQAGALGGSGKIYVLNMGEPIKIIDLAKKMAKLSGLDVVDKKMEPNQIEIKIIGLREGEKNFEELYYEDIKKTIHPKINEENYAINNNINFRDLINKLENFILNGDNIAAKNLIFSQIKEL